MNKKLKKENNVGATISRPEKGITLVALVITIIVLIILAGVSINAVMNGGLITNAREAKNKYEDGKAKEQKVLSQLEISEVEMDFIKKGVPYNFKHRYLTGVELGEKAVNLKKELNKYGYELCDIDGNVIQETDETTIVSTGMLIKEIEKIDEDAAIGEVVIFGDVGGAGDGVSSATALIKQITAASNDTPTELQKVAADVNHDGYIDEYDAWLSEMSNAGAYQIEQKANANIPDIKYYDEYVADVLKNANLQIQNKGHKKVVVSGVEVGTTVGELYKILSEKIDLDITIDEIEDETDTSVVKNGSAITVCDYDIYNSTISSEIFSVSIVLFGDIDKDGDIDGDDLTAMETRMTETNLTSARNNESVQTLACDINGDGDLTKADYDALESYLDPNSDTVSQINQNRKARLFVKDWSTWESIVF